MGESTPIYLVYPGRSEKIHAILGDIPVIVIIRDPAARIYSQYWHNVKYGRERLSFTGPLSREFWRRQNLGLSYYRHYAYYPRSSYCEHINNFQRLFSRVHICKFEELIEEPEKALHKIHKLLGVNSYIEEQFSRLHANSSATYRFSFVNSLLNKVEDKVGVTKPKDYLLRINFKKYTYPKISVEEREFVVRELRNICPEVMKDYGYC